MVNTSSCFRRVEGTEGVIYELSSDGTYAIVKGYEGTATEVVIAKTYEGVPVTEIGDAAFYGCASLTDVYYRSTEEMWAEISIGSDNEDLISANIHFESVYTVTFVTRDPATGVLITLYTQSVVSGDLVTRPEDPFIGETYAFESWRVDRATVWNFETDVVTGDMTLQAYWTNPGSGFDEGVNGPWIDNPTIN